MPLPFRAPAGTYDFLPNDHAIFAFIKKIVRHRFRQAGFVRFTPPTFEDAKIFETALGLSSKVIQRELYTFYDRQKRLHALRPELTTGTVRSFIEKEMHQGPLPVELYYIERCYRFGRPSQQTQREFLQFGGEILGETDPALDAQVIYLGHRILNDLQLGSQCTLEINTIGTPDDRQRFFEALLNFYAGKERHLSPESKENLEQKRLLELLNPLTEDEKVLANMAPKIADYLSPASQDFFTQLQSYLGDFQIPFEINTQLVRPLDYYSGTVFEFKTKLAGHKIITGGRYDGLMARLGGPDLGGVGFSAGVERIITLMREQKISFPFKDALQLFISATGKTAKSKALPLLVRLREHGFHAVGVLGRTSTEEQLRRAEAFGVPYTILIGDLEIRKNQVIIRDMKTRKQTWIPEEDLIDKLDELLGAPVALDTTIDFLGHE